MKVVDFRTLKKINKNGFIKYRVNESLYHKAIIDSDIPFKPGVYLMYAVKEGLEIELIYIGKAGETGSKLNSHPLPVRLLAPELLPIWHKEYRKGKKKYMTRVKLIPEKVKYYKYDGLNIYWFQTYPELNCNEIERELILECKKQNNNKLPLWMSK